MSSDRKKCILKTVENAYLIKMCPALWVKVCYNYRLNAYIYSQVCPGQG